MQTLQASRDARRSSFAPPAVAGLLAVHAVLLAYSGWVHSPTLNEPGHLVAGISHWQFGRFELYRVNPPLVRMVAALPVIAAGYEEDWSGFFDGPGTRPVFGMGEAFVAANGERAFWLFTLARWACIPLSLLGGLVCYLWGRDLFGHPSGLVACGLWCFSPNILGHAALITPDAHGAALGLAASYAFWRWLIVPTWTQVAAAGLLLGLAQLTKMTLLLFFPLWPFLWIAYRTWSKDATGRHGWGRDAGMMSVMLLLGLYVLNTGYGFEGSLTPLGRFHFVSDLFTGQASDDRSAGEGRDLIASPRVGRISNPSHQTDGLENRPTSNRFADSWIGAIPALVPRNYALGIDIQQRDFEGYGARSYLRGEFREKGWWFYYLYAAAVKVPLGTWLLGLVLVGGAAWRLWRPGGRETDGHRSIGASAGGDWRDQMVLLAPAALIFAVVSAKTGFSEHMRYVLPTFPFVWVWLGQVGPWCLPRSSFTAANRSCGAIAGIALIWTIGSSLFVYPHSLSYFNALGGGPLGGHRHLIQSNIDWGQDLLYLRRWMEAHPEARPLHLAYFGGFDPAKVGFSETRPVQLQTRGVERGSERGPSRWIAISVTHLRGYPHAARDGSTGGGSLKRQYARGFLDRQPVGYAGYSIYVYQIDSATFPENPANH